MRADIPLAIWLSIQKIRDYQMAKLHSSDEDKIDGIILFGSVAKGEATEDSDIDIIVIWKGDEAEGWRAMTGLAFEVLLEEEEYISVKVLGLEDLKAENPFVKNVLKEGIKIA